MIVFFVVLFFVGYLIIALEHPMKIDKSATALLLGMLMWVLFAFYCEDIIPAKYPTALAEFKVYSGLENPSQHELSLAYLLEVLIPYDLGDITQTLFFLIGAMTIVELIDVHNGFTVITNRINTKNKRKLLIVVTCVTFCLSALLDNLTTTIVMLMLIRKLIDDRKVRWMFACMIVIAANTGGAWSPIGDVTTIMLWVKGNVTTGALISYVLLPSLVACAVPLWMVCRQLSGEVVPPSRVEVIRDTTTPSEQRQIFLLGVLGLIFVPIMKTITHLPPFICVMFILGLLWVYSEIFYNRKKLKRDKENRMFKVIKRIDMSTILFFFGILMAVAVLQRVGILNNCAQWLDEKVHNVYIISLILGVLSSIVDNVPLVAAAMGMYPVEAASATGYAANFVVDGTFWEFLSYCSGVGGSMLIIGSAAGVIAMGIEKVEFGYYLKKFTLIALVGYLAGAAVYILESEFVKPLIGV